MNTGRRARGALLPVFFLMAALLQAAPWTQEAYVWQRSPEPVLELAAVEGRKAPEGAARGSVAEVALDGVALLAAEVSWRGGRAEAVYSEIKYKAAALCIQKRITLVLRAGPFSGDFAPGAPACASLRVVLREVLARARAGGLEPAELQLDFDCAQARLAGYAGWLRTLKADCDGLPLTFTALPSWLGCAGLEELVTAADGFVLQVHALEKPSQIRSIPPLCDPERALVWVKRAGRLGRPFRVALPTYGYLLAFSPAGKFIGFSSGQRRPGWPADCLLRELRADEAQMALLAASLRSEHPAACTGLLWFRLPAEGDQLNWRWPAFAEVLLGGAPLAAPRAECIQKSDTLWELVFSNAGTASCIAPERLVVAWPATLRALACDAQGGASVRLEPGVGSAVFSLPTRGSLPLRVEPGRSVVLGWLRLEGAGKPFVEVIVE